MKTFNNIHSHIGILRHILQVSEEAKKTEILSYLVTLLQIDLINVRTSQVMQFFPSNQAVRVMELERGTCAVIEPGPCIGIPAPSAGSSVLFSQYFCTSTEYKCLLSSHIQKFYLQFLRALGHLQNLSAMTSLSTFLPMHLLPWIWISMSSQAWTPRVAWCHRSTQVQSYFCCCRLLTGFPIWTLDPHNGCIVCSPTLILVPIVCSPTQ